MPLVMDVFAILFSCAAIATNLWVGGDVDLSVFFLLLGLLAFTANMSIRGVIAIRGRFNDAVIISVLFMG